MKKLTLMLGLVCVGLTGCPPNKLAEKKGETVFPMTQQPVSTMDVSPGDGLPTISRGHSKLDAQPDVAVIVNLNVCHVAAPAWSISSNSAFWKHVDENRLEVDVKDLMQFNGFRMGLAPQADWPYFKSIFDQQMVISQKTGGTAVNGPSAIDMPFRQNIDREYIAWYDPTYQLAGQIYDRCDNWMTIRFEPVRRSPGTVRVKLTPMVRSQRVEVRYTALERPIEWPMVRPEYLWDVLSQVDIPIDYFLVIAPTPDRNDGPTLGHRFLLSDGMGEPSEHLLLISPQPFRFDAKSPATNPAK